MISISMNNVIILFGVNGSGKSHIAKLIQKEFGYQYISIEEFFIENYGDVENYRKNSKQAWKLLKAHIDSQVALNQKVCFELVFPELENVLIDYDNPTIDYKFVRVDVSLETSLSRVDSRGLRQNFPKSREFVTQTYNKFYSEQYKQFPFDLHIHNENVSEVVLIESLKNILP